MSTKEYVFEAELLKVAHRVLDVLERMVKRLEEIETNVEERHG